MRRETGLLCEIGMRFHVRQTRCWTEFVVSLELFGRYILCALYAEPINEAVWCVTRYDLGKGWLFDDAHYVERCSK